MKYKAIADIILYLTVRGYHVTLSKNETYFQSNEAGTSLLLYGDELSEKQTTRQNIIETLIDQNSACRYESTPCDNCEGTGFERGKECELCLGDGYLLKELQGGGS